MPRARYCVIRILGNELPPRDRPGRRVHVLRFQIEKEPRPEGTTRLWVLNRIHEPAFREELVGILKGAGERFVEIPFEGERYAECLTKAQRLVYAINVNGARNEAIRMGQAEARFSLVLDGDCWLGPEEWRLLEEGVARDQAAHPDRKYYSLPMIRATFEEALAGELRHRLLEEPQLAFRDDADLRFDESRVFGDKDKVELLERLGHAAYQPGAAVEHALAPDAPCASVGRIIHLQTGEDAAEDSRIERGRLRELSVRRLLRKLGERHPPKAGLLARAAARLMETKTGDPAPDAELEAPRWRADFRSFSAGDGLSLVYGPDGKAHLMPDRLRDALDKCRRFRTLAHHAHDCAKGSGERLMSALKRWREQAGLPKGSGHTETNLRQAFEILAADGLFVSAPDVIALCRRRQLPPRVGALGLLVRGTAPEAAARLRAALTTQPPRLFACAGEEAPGLREAVEAEARPAGARLAWLGRAERQALARKLVAAGADPAVCEYALLGDSAGALRNAFLLAAAGAPALLLDSDALSPAEAAPLADHERWLGRSLGPDVFALETVSSEALRRLRGGRSLLRASFRACLPVREDGRPARDRAARQRQFRRAMQAEGEIPGLGGTALTDGFDLEAGELGLDLRDPLVPFPAGMAGEDGPFAAALAVCHDLDFAARLPGTLAKPLRLARRFPCDRSAKAGLTAAALLGLLLQAAAPPRALDLSGPRREAMAEALGELASSSERAFAAFTARVARRQAAELALACDRAARQPLSWPPLKGEELRQEAERLLMESRRPDLHVPIDAASAQKAAADYAALLAAWPGLVAAARSAKEALV